MNDSAIISVTLDCADPENLARFWRAALGYEQVAKVDDFVVLGPATERIGPKLALQRVSEQRGLKNRMHLDLWVIDVEAEVARLEGIGAKRLHDRPFDEHGLHWFQLADPEGNEFCVARG
jgi:catechol 2,3-dioxygenase-like lactoylglutathione lyase family enzyme